MSDMIELELMTKPGFRGKVRKYKTMAGAKRAATKMLGSDVRRDPDGYAVGKHGVCLFFRGCTFEDIFPWVKPPDSE